MIINNLGINFAGGGGSCPPGECTLQRKDFSITTNGDTSITPDSGKDGISAGTISVNVDMGPAYSSGYTEGYASGETAGAAAQKALLSSATITENGTVTSENGFSAVTVNVSGGGGGENRLNDFFNNRVTAVTQSDLSGVTAIKDYQFYNMTSLKSVDLPSSVITIGGNGFRGSGIETLDVSNIITYGSNTFQECSSLTGITGFENFHGNLPGSMFSGCTSLTGDFRTNASACTNSGVFTNCSGITSFTFTGPISGIGAGNSSRPFAGCTGVQYLDFTNAPTVPSLGASNYFTAFTQNYEIRVPALLYDSYTGATNWSATSVVSHIVPCASTMDWTSISYKVNNGVEPSLYKLDGYMVSSSTFDSTTGEGEKKVYGLTMLPAYILTGNNYSSNQTVTDIVVGEGVKIIGDSCFYNCSALSGITLPSTTQLIETHWKLFGYSISTLTIKAVTPPKLQSLAFRDSGYASTGTLYVPAQSISAYQTWLTQSAAQAISGWTVQAIAE